MKRNTIIVAVIAFIIVIVLPMGIWWQDRRTPGKLDTFAQCLGEKGAIFYGAFWCPHCQEQKALFGKSKTKLPYVECSQPNRKQNQTCNDKEVKSYPTWDFADGSRETGLLSLETLAQKTSCPLPENL